MIITLKSQAHGDKNKETLKIKKHWYIPIDILYSGKTGQKIPDWGKISTKYK